jgi:cytochrome b subunit of formate dehydrogenase
MFWSAAFLLLLPAAAWAQKSEDCLACHSDRTLSLRRRGQTVPLFVDRDKLKGSAHSGMECIDCHQGLKAEDLPHAKKIRPVNCQSCHDIANFESSIHGKPLPQQEDAKKTEMAASCRDCHGTHDILSPGNPKSPTNRTHLAQTCGRCHQTEDQHFAKSAHGIALAAGIKGAPSCIDCHGEHNVEPITSQRSPMNATREAKVCLKCHLDNPDIRERIGPSAGFIAAYEASVHGMALARGNLKAATCDDCHGAHDMKKGIDPSSLVSKQNIAATCSKCHGEITKNYNESIHGIALQRGSRESPTCTDCHGEHQILGHKDPRSRVAAQNVSIQVCGACHDSVRLSQKYGFSTERFQSFEDSYHGLASKAGSVRVANCASCHGVHNIKPSTDPASTINPTNLAVTCGACHPGANNNFTKGRVHVTYSKSDEAILYWIRLFYISLIVSTIGGMLLHNLLDFVKKSRHRFAIRTGMLLPEHFGAARYVRMSLSERIQHGLLFTSFISLVITGFMLKFPDAWWVIPIRQWSEKVFEVRGLIHRIAGVILIAVSLYHAYHLAFVARGRQLLKDMLPKLKDVGDFRDLMLHNLGISKKKAMFDRFGYVEKAEYWALVWGTVVMAGTGMIMWFDNYFINRFTKLGWDIARTIHYYEAILATLAIVVWHFYFVIFNPSVYPMNTAWWTGMLTEEEMAEEHPLELERIRSQQVREEMKETD